MRYVLIAGAIVVLLAGCAGPAAEPREPMDDPTKPAALEVAPTPAVLNNLSPVEPQMDPAASYPEPTAPSGDLSAYPAPPTESPPPGSYPDAPEDSPPTSDFLGPLLDAILADLSNVSGVPAEEITLVSIEQATWPDGGLGCPDPDMMYIQMIIEGALATLEAGGETYTYHTGGNSFVLCRDGRPASTGSAP